MYNPSSKIDWKIYLYFARDCKKIAGQTLDSGEKIKIMEISYDEFLDIIPVNSLLNDLVGNELFRLE